MANRPWKKTSGTDSLNNPSQIALSRRNKSSSLNAQLDDVVLEKCKLIVCEAGGGGDCLFYAVLAAMNYSAGNDQKMMEALRTDIGPDVRSVLEIKEANDPTFLEGFFFESTVKTIDDYVKAIQKPGEWGGDAEIQALATFFNVNIVVLSPSPIDGSRQSMFINVNYPQIKRTNTEWVDHRSTDTIGLLCVDNQHFQPLTQHTGRKNLNDHFYFRSLDGHMDVMAIARAVYHSAAVKSASAAAASPPAAAAAPTKPTTAAAAASPPAAAAAPTKPTTAAAAASPPAAAAASPPAAAAAASVTATTATTAAPTSVDTSNAGIVPSSVTTLPSTTSTGIPGPSIHVAPVPWTGARPTPHKESSLYKASIPKIPVTGKAVVALVNWPVCNTMNGTSTLDLPELNGYVEMARTTGEFNASGMADKAVIFCRANDVSLFRTVSETDFAVTFTFDSVSTTVPSTGSISGSMADSISVVPALRHVVDLCG